MVFCIKDALGGRMLGPLVMTILPIGLAMSMLPPGGQLDEQRLLTDLLRDYDPGVRPILTLHNYSGGIEQVMVTITLQINKVDGIEWTDGRLTWNPEDYGGINEIYLSPSKVWLPRFALTNSATDTQYEEDYYTWFWVSVYSDGEISWLPGGSFESKCKIGISMFPFDYQTCELVYPSYNVNLSYAGADVLFETYTENGEWDIANASVWRVDVGYEGVDEVYAEVHYVFLLRRKPMFFIMNIIIPSVLLSALVLLVFRLPPGSGEKISMAVTLLLSYSVFILLISDNVPETSEAVPLIVLYLITFMATTCITVAMSVLVLEFHHREGIQRPGHCLKVVMLGLARIVRFNVQYLDLQRKQKHSQCDEDTVTGTKISHLASTSIVVDHLGNPAHFVDGISQSVEFEGKPELQKRLGNKAIGDEEQDAAGREWKEIAAIIDTFCLWVSLLILVFAVIFLLVIWPYVYPKPTI